MHFLYSFNLADVIPHIDSYEKSIQYAAERQIVKVIYESFVIPADQDYLTARLLAQKGLPRGFFWGAAQAAEKYLKALLLLSGEEVRSYNGHPIFKLYEAAAAIEPDLKKIDTSPHRCITNSSGSKTVMQIFTVEELLKELETFGAPDNRYNSVGVEYNTGHLLAFDAFVHQIRSFVGVPDISESHKKLTKDLIDSFHNVNPWFNPLTEASIALPAEGLPLQATGTVTHLEFISQNQKTIECALALKWLSKKMKLPKGAANPK